MSNKKQNEYKGGPKPTNNSHVTYIFFNHVAPGYIFKQMFIFREPSEITSIHSV